MFDLFQCPTCKTSYGSFKEAWDCVQWHPRFTDTDRNKREHRDDSDPGKESQR